MKWYFMYLIPSHSRANVRYNSWSFFFHYLQTSQRLLYESPGIALILQNDNGHNSLLFASGFGDSKQLASLCESFL